MAGRHDHRQPASLRLLARFSAALQFGDGQGDARLLPPEEQQRYIDKVVFEAITPFTTRRDQIDAMLERVRNAGVIHDRDGHLVGAGATASPIFDRDGQVFAAVVAAGPNERMDESPVPIAQRVREAGTRISRIMTARRGAGTGS